MSHQNLHPSARLKRLRENLDLSQRDLAQEFNVTPGAIAQWELGTNPVPGPIIRLMDIYEQQTLFMDFEQQKFLEELKAAIKQLAKKSEDAKLIEDGFTTFFKDAGFLNHLNTKMKYAISSRMLRFLSGSKGLTVKVAQLASYMEVGLPNEVRLALGNLQQQMRPMSKKTVHGILESAYKDPFKNVFAEFNFAPVAVTSMGQVHYAKLKNGREAAVKIQSPKVKEILNSQFDKLSFLEKMGGMINKDISTIFSEIRRAVLEECDYLEEAKNQIKIRELVGHLPRTIIPPVIMDLTRKNILVSEFYHAENFYSFCTRASQDSRNIVGETIIKTLSHLAFVHGYVLGDIHPENFLINKDKVVFLDFGRIFKATKEHMRYQSMFYQALLLNNKERSKVIAEKLNFSKNPEHFDFDEFWIFLRNSSEHLLVDRKFKFTREYVAKINREGRRFNHKRSLHLSPSLFWGFTFSAGTWSLFAQLEAECEWRKIALNTFEDSLSNRF